MQRPGGRNRTLVIGAIVAGVLFLGLIGVVVALATIRPPVIVQTVQPAPSPSSSSDATDATDPNDASEFPDHPPAGTTIAGTAVAVADAPFVVTSCSGVRTPAAQLWISVNIHNAGAKPLASTEVLVAGIDAHGTPIADSETSLGTFLDDDAESIDPQADYDSTGTYEHANPLIETITCTPTKATFADGTSWAAPASGH